MPIHTLREQRSSSSAVTRAAHTHALSLLLPLAHAPHAFSVAVPQGGGVDAVASEAAALLASGHYDAERIEARKNTIEARWAHLLKAAEERKVKLGEALEYQQ